MPDHRSATLDNGLHILGEIDADAHSASMGYFVKTGARDESSSLMGVSHFLEHMMFKGTDRRSAADVNLEFDAMGANYNAYTSNEITCFYASVLPERFPDAADLLTDILRPALRDDDFEMERNVILEEIAMYNDQPFWKLYERAMEEHYGTHPLAHRVLGTPGTIAGLSAQAMRDYFTSRYAPDNMAVALAGRIDFDRAVDHLRELTSGWSPTGVTRDHGHPAPAGADFELRDERVNRAYMLLIAPGPAYHDERRYAAMLLGRILGGPDNSRLHWALIETGLAEEALAEYDGRDGCGDFYVYASGDPDRAERIWTIVQEEIVMLGESITEADLEKLRSKLATQITLGGERPGGRMQRLGRNRMYLDSYVSLEDELERINAVTVEDLRAVLRDFPFEPRTVGRLLPTA